ncbi:amidohydrolase family protein [Glacieibacterium megasporae]|uniref:amidohydrolase family protein n=1 Tax=Glacieibacterium megasporae TaxID=2835787 RepID=UPI001C1E6FE4|nr:amidohydrolase family protein [Polymorphobacter megasporae]UAJ09081.1 amidohydrolase [Polymorphobacter megasporae]
MPVSRRAVMIGGAAITLGGALRAQPAHVFTSSAIDVHHHYLPPFYKPLAKPWLDRFATGVDAVLAWTPEASLAAMDAAQVERVVLSISAPGVHFGDDAQAQSLARDCNDYASALGASHKGRFDFFAALPMPDVDGAIREAERALALPGARGVGLLSNYGGRYLGDAHFAPLFAWLGRRGAIVYVHPTDAPCCTGLVPEMATPLIEFPVDTGRTIASLLWSGMLSAHPNIRFIFSHGGGILPMVAERVASMGYVRRDLMAKVPGGAMAALSRIYVDTASVTTPGAMAALTASLPADHILYGTDFPWGGLANSRAALKRLDLSASQLDGIESRNARTLLGI